jgi:hypothetical protein
LKCIGIPKLFKAKGLVDEARPMAAPASSGIGASSLASFFSSPSLASFFSSPSLASFFSSPSLASFFSSLDSSFFSGFFSSLPSGLTAASAYSFGVISSGHNSGISHCLAS